MLEFVENDRDGAQIRIVGIGGAGGNAINTMIGAGWSVSISLLPTTDVQALQMNWRRPTLQLGSDLTKGLGAGANPEIGRRSTIESEEELGRHLQGADMIFITAGMGGGTGTGGLRLRPGLPKRRVRSLLVCHEALPV